MFAVYDITTGEVSSFTMKDNPPAGFATYDVGENMVDTKTTYFPGGVMTTRQAAPDPVEDFLLVEKIRKEVQDRIFAVASANTQSNMLAASATGTMTVTERLHLKEGFIWIQDMRAAGAVLAQNKDQTYKDDSHWPVCPPNAAALAANY